MSKFRNTFPLQLETLERRNLMAGNVRAALNAEGDLLVTGDNYSNAIIIDNVGTTLRVRQNPDLVSQFGVTKINGVTNGVFRVSTSRLTDDFHIRMNGGHDVVSIIGDGDVLLEGVVVQDDLFMQLGSGNDLVDISNCFVWGSSDINTGTGTNYTYLGRFFTNHDLLVANSAEALSSQHDEVYLVGGVDVGDDLTIDLYNGRDIVDIDESAFGDLYINLYGGDDKLTIRNTTVERLSDLDGGSGLDTYTRSGNNKTFTTINFERFRR